MAYSKSPFNLFDQKKDSKAKITNRIAPDQESLTHDLAIIRTIRIRGQGTTARTMRERKRWRDKGRKGKSMGGMGDAKWKEGRRRQRRMRG